MKCTYCGFESNTEYKFCTNCGAANPHYQQSENDSIMQQSTPQHSASDTSTIFESGYHSSQGDQRSYSSQLKNDYNKPQSKKTHRLTNNEPSDPNQQTINATIVISGLKGQILGSLVSLGVSVLGFFIPLFPLTIFACIMALILTLTSISVVKKTQSKGSLIPVLIGVISLVVAIIATIRAPAFDF
ncbi:MAG: zinc ribbon domain-containing protein [Christensenellaceae bacterium]|jgi:hypothetical protein|nr:zinc ribbon domain-containing protein [Christensenellaceae bacterium]